MDKERLLKRDEIDDKYKWDVASFYRDLDAWERDYKETKFLISEFPKYQGRLKECSERLYEALYDYGTIDRRVSNLYSYASLRQDEDTRDNKYQALADKAFRLAIEANEKTAFLTPEILTFKEEEISKFLSDNEELRLYKHYLDETLRVKDHILSAREESIMAQVGELSSAAQNIYGMLNNADIKFPTIKNEEGKEVEITQGNFIPLMESADREVRKNAFEGLYGVYSSLINTFSATLDGELKANKFNANIRGYKNTMEASLDQNNIPTAVYDNLLDSIHNNLEPMYKYMGIRKRALGLDELHMYDIYNPIVEDVSFKYSFEEAKELITKALEPLGEDYIEIVKEGFNSGWIDVYENEGKRSGGYSGGSYDSKPYILLNYKDTLDSVFTTAHEMGHSIHSYLSRENQPYVYSGYGIFVAEVASTVNEVLLINYLLENVKTEDERKYIINHYLDSFRATVYRQSMFAEFEKMINEHIARGEALTSDYLCEEYGKLNQLYFGDNVVIDDEIKVEWSRIPHFYYNYYVYQYATGFSSAVTIADKILKGEEGIVEKYINFLSSGSSDYPINILKEVGIDMTTTEPVDKALKQFAKLVDEMDKLV